MNQMFYTYILNRKLYKFFWECKRFAGHSKWQNIKHQKEANDAERSLLYRQLRNKIRYAVLNGGINPKTNENLARVLEQCKKFNMPLKSVNNILEKLNTTKEASEHTFIEIKGPCKCHMIIKIITSNMTQTKLNLYSTLKKTNVKITEGFKNSMFEHNGIVIIEKKYDLDKAMEDAINIGATDIEEIENDNNKYYKLKCEPQLLPKVKTQLQSLGYIIVSIEEEIIPFSAVKFNDTDLEIIKSIQEKLLKLDEVHEIYDNIDRGNLLN